MNEVMKIADIEATFASEWVLVGDPVTDRTLNVRSGRILAHSPDRDEMYRHAMKLKPKRFAVLYTGVMPEHVMLNL